MHKSRYVEAPATRDVAEVDAEHVGAPPPAATAWVLGVQRTAGNAAVNRLLTAARPARPRPGRARLARFVGTEHESLGDTTGTSIDLGNGVVLTWGEVLAIAGDEYATVDDLLADTRDDAGKARLRAALEHDGIPGTIAGTLPAPTKDQVSAHDAKFIELALVNASHFPDGGEAIGAWARNHAIAIESAVTAGLAADAAGMSAAYLNEAFGEHFLTDCFSGGHIRTPRRQIIDWYVGTFGPRVAGPLVANLKTRLVDALMREASPQTSVPDFKIRSDIEEVVNPGIDNAITGLGGIAKLAEFIGLGVGGAISGAMHDQEGNRGVMVASDDHPDPWRAYGDGDLSKSPVSREQATRAIAEAKAQVDEAFIFGEEEAVTRNTVPAVPPERIHFAFGSSDLNAEGRSAVSAVSAYMLYRPDAVVDVVGHTDPIGSDSSNDALGQARADAVASALMSLGVAPMRVKSHSMGERALVTTDPKRYAEDRRSDFGWATGAAPAPASGTDPTDQERATQRAMARAQERAETALVLRFVPRPVEEREQASVPGGNSELPEWHWGSLDATFRATLDDYIRTEVGARLESQLDGVTQLDPVTRTVPVTGTVITVHPRDRAKEIVRALLANPTSQLGNLTGDVPGP
jgi:outer membrane protein OmpA-like peptidoglycan-associated protein